MLTGRQIRDARALLGLKRGVLARRVGSIGGLDILRAEQAEDGSTLSPKQAVAIQRALEAAGVEFTIAPAGVRLRQVGQPSEEAGR